MRIRSSLVLINISITGVQLALLNALAKGPLTVAEFEKNYYVTPGAAEHNMKALHTRKYIQRAETTTKKAKPYVLTPLGELALAFFLKYREAHPPRMPGSVRNYST